MGRIIQIKRGPKSTMPTLSQGELAMTTDTGSESLFIGTGTENIELARKSDLDAIPIPDVSGQISTHNSDSSAHSDIRESITTHTGDMSVHVTTEEKATWNAKADTQFKPAGKSYLSFSSPNSFTLAVGDSTKHWNGTLEYFSADKSWTTWDGTTTLSSVDNDGEHVLYLRGTGNTVITGNSKNYSWVLTGSDIVCDGNIENLLDYATVKSGSNPTMANYCYSYIFNGCTALTQAPALPATTLADYCYQYMFNGCISLTQAPALPATTLADYCYQNMFRGCTALTQAPALPATTLADYCYQYMFNQCSSLTQAPALPAITLAGHCYQSMFNGCISLTQAPALPATTLANSCYQYMFQKCTSLTLAPALSATTLVGNCYRYMFSGCASLAQAPALPATTLADGCYSFMFYGCSSLTKAPALPATTLANYCYSNMFYACGSLKLSSTQTGECIQEYRIPTAGTGTTATDALTDMFASTGGIFTDTPEINTTYYLSSDNMVVYETEIDTLNEYVGSIAAPASHASDEIVHITDAERNAWNAKLDNFTETDPTVPAWAKAESKPTYTASEVGADPSGSALQALADAKSYTDTQIASIPTPDVSGQISTHNTNATAHNDIRELVSGLTTRLNALADSDDATLDQLSEIVAYIKNNKSLIDGITTSKVNVSDIIDNLTTNVTNKPLSAAQGVALKALIDAITVPTKVSELTNDSGYLTSFTETDPTVPAWAKAASKPTYTASEVGAVPTSRTVNGKALSANITLAASDVGADTSGSAAQALADAKSYTDSSIQTAIQNSWEASY